MKLADLQTGQQGVIAKVNGHGSFRKRLIEMGFIAGSKVTVIQNAPLRDPVEYEILGYRLSLRRSEAEMIEVISEEEAKEHIAVEHVLERLESDEQTLVRREMSELADERSHVIRVALVGNPNCGKTSLFNIASGSHEHVGNYTGVTVDAKEGRFSYGGYQFVLVDLPGTYSLSAYSPEELYVRKNLVENMPDVVINVVDASNIERNLYLTTQIIDMNLRTVIALNMFDELEAKGDRIDLRQLGWLLGVPVCPTVSRDGRGIPELFDTVIKVYTQSDPALARHIHINHGPELEKSIGRLQGLMRANDILRDRYSTRYLAIKYLEHDADIERLLADVTNREILAATRGEEEARIASLLGNGTEAAIVDAKYAFIRGALAETYRSPVTPHPKRTLADRIDAVVTHKWLAFPIFILLLYIMFQATFSLGNYPMEWIDWLVGKTGGLAGAHLPDGWLKNLVVDGIIAGVGSVLVFLPNILILYFFISLLEDSGYMARAAFIVDRLMHRIGLHGKSFIPMVMGFGCNVPAIMATRSIESRKSRLITIAIIPFMSCAGRLPVFVLIAGAFFPHHSALVLLGIYLLGIVLAILSALMLSRFVHDDDLPFVMELPPYRIPTAKAIWRHTWEKGRQYLQKMATTILFCSVIIWFLGYFPRNEQLAPAARQEASYIGRLGQAVSPVLDPLGFTWKMDVSLLTGIAAKELVVSSLGVMYADPAASSAEEELEDELEVRTNAVREADGETDGGADETALQAALTGAIPWPAALAFMVFVLLYFPCIATFVAIRNETGRWGWAIGCIAYTMLVAWVCAFITYRLGMLFL